MKSRCPSHHVDWVYGGYDDLLYNFVKTLPESIRRKVNSITEAESARRCAREVAGFSCEMGVNLDAFNKLGLMDRFVEFGCRHVRCRDIALCTTDYQE